MKTYTNEYGRSMVEILGVLAIIGVLSIGGIQGYRYAFTKYRANDIVNAVNMRASDIYNRFQAIQMPEEADFSEWSETTETGFPIFIEKMPNVNMVQIEVEDVPTDVCKEVMKEAPFIASANGIKFVNVALGENLGGADLCENDEESTKGLLFTSVTNDTDAEGNEIGECLLDMDCTSACGESICDEEHGYICTTGCRNNEVCNEETGTCEELTFCVDGQEFRSRAGACISCVAKGSYEISSKDEPYVDEELNIEDESSAKVQCDKCGRTIEETGGKTYCSTVCLNGKGYVPLTGVKNEYGLTQYSELDYLNGCVRCDNPYDYAINSSSAEAKAGCTACGHKTYWTSVWPSTLVCGPVQCGEGEFKHHYRLAGSGERGGQCISCDDPAPRYTGNVALFKTMCEDPACGRKVVGNWCVLENCGENEFLSASYGRTQGQFITLGGCKSCTAQSSYRLGSYTVTTDKTTGEKTYTVNAELQYFINQCEKCNDTNGDGTISEDEKDSVRKVEHDATGTAFCVFSSSNCDGVLGLSGECIPCSDLGTGKNEQGVDRKKKVAIISDTASGCTKNCGDKAWVVYDNADGAGYYCYQKCADNQFQDYGGTCYPCSQSGAAWTYSLPDLQTKCSNCPADTPRLNHSQHCYKQLTCETGKSFFSPGKGCVSCDSTSDYAVYGADIENCKACSPSNANLGRWYHNNLCSPIIENINGICNSLSATEMGLTYNGTDGAFLKSSSDGKCYACDTPSDVQTTLAQCQTCGNQRQYDGNKCVIYNGCNGGSTFWSVPNHTCVACSISTAKVETSYDERHLCDACPKKRSMLLKVNNQTNAYCVKKCEENQWQDSNGTCYACTNTTEREIGTDDESRRLCRVCPNKQEEAIRDEDNVIIGYKCVQKA